jgi:hypothetical protein
MPIRQSKVILPFRQQVSFPTDKDYNTDITARRWMLEVGWTSIILIRQYQRQNKWHYTKRYYFVGLTKKWGWDVEELWKYDTNESRSLDIGFLRIEWR